MKLVHLKLIILLSFGITNSSLYSGVKQNILSLARRVVGDTDDANNKINASNVNILKLSTKTLHNDRDAARHKSDVIQKARAFENRLNNLHNLQFDPQIRSAAVDYFHIDPVLNSLRRYSGTTKKAGDKSTTSSSSTSTEIEEPYWEDAFEDFMLQKKWEAINSSIPEIPPINMAAARPWGDSCGDIQQHDMPWGTCVLAQECLAEFRIYRGDHFCGKTEFVCCAVSNNNYDLYGAVDISFEDSKFATDTEEKINATLHGGRDAKNARNKKNYRMRKRARDKRKKLIKRNINKIIKQMRILMDKMYKNGSKLRNKKTRMLKRFVKDLKKQYMKDRVSVKRIHEDEMEFIDNTLKTRILQVKRLNQNFMRNSTFREIVVKILGNSSKVSKKGLRMLSEAYPELDDLIYHRSGRRQMDLGDTDYDIDFGLLYY